jgi:hypothetical protein
MISPIMIYDHNDYEKTSGFRCPHSFNTYLEPNNRTKNIIFIFFPLKAMMFDDV